jgi:hypothetical protein
MDDSHNTGTGAKKPLFLKAALAYAQRLQWPVFPLKPRGKEPLTPHGYKDASVDAKQIHEWWRKWPTANIGTPTGVRFWVLDIDPRHGGKESLMGLVAKHSGLADTIRQTTGGGGEHYLYEVPGQQVIGCHTGIWPGIDVKGEGGYIVVAPSIHPSGNPYFWDTPKQSILEETVNPANPWLLVEIMAATNTHAHGPFSLPEKIPHGKQHKTLFQMGCAMRAKGCGAAEIVEALWQVNESRCEKPGSRKNIEKLAASVCARYPPGESQQRPERQRAEPSAGRPEPPKVLTYVELREVKRPVTEMLFEDYPLPACGATLMFGQSRAGKTILAVQQALAVARGKPLFDYYRVRKPGAVLVVEQDDPAGSASVGHLVERSGGGPEDMPFHAAEKLPFSFGPAFLEWLEKEITTRKLVMVVLDSYTALRGSRGPGIDIVKAEQMDLSQLDALGKRLECAIVIIHHDSTGKAQRNIDWNQTAAGTFAMGMATEAQVHVSRFADLDIKAPERLVRMRPRHGTDVHLVLRFRENTEQYEHVLESSAAAWYPLMRQIRAEFGKEPFGPKALTQITGVTSATVHRWLDRLQIAGAVQRLGRGEYRLIANV